MAEASILTPVTDRSLFSMHPEDWVTQRDSHDEQGAYLKGALRVVLPDCFVARDLAVYWVPGRFQEPYVSPDIFVSRQQPRVTDPTAWVVYEDGPLDLVIEVASDATRENEAKKRDETYAVELEVPEHLLLDLYRDQIELSRLVGGRYEPVPPDERGVYWSQELGVGFLWRPGERLVRVLTRDGEIVPTGREGRALRREEAARQRAAERRERRAAARQHEAEAWQQAAAARAEALAAEVERLRRALENSGRTERSEDESDDAAP